jgi:hypothetical protein
MTISLKERRKVYYQLIKKGISPRLSKVVAFLPESTIKEEQLDEFKIKKED